MEITWLSHSAFLIESDEGVKILIDPFISNNPACTIPVEEIEADIICITHGHSDHFGDAMEIAHECNAPIICIHEIGLFLSKQGIDNITMNIGGSVVVRGIKFTMLDATHSSALDVVEEPVAGGNPASFLITFENGEKLFHAGDTGLYSDMKEVIGQIYKPDIAILPIGDRFTMGPFEAALAAMWINPKYVLPMHYNTFPAIEQDPTVFSNFVTQLNPKIETVIINPLETYVPNLDSKIE
ncbi:MAG: metal-dependent hydrolase [Methanobacteriaceae archaeon]|nr:metal-dependent hydrolase [Methanobacteriaceae archaeon]